MIVTPEIAAAALLERRQARRALPDWARTCGFEPARHHLFLLEKLRGVAVEKGKRLMVFMPPRSAKSTYCSVIFPPWFLAQSPSSSIICASHSADLAESFGRRARNLINEHHKVLGYNLREDSRAAAEWSTTNGSSFYGVGVGGSPTGRGAQLILIDDPVASKEDAYSKSCREKTWNWYEFDLRTRLEKNGSIILIMTRWHDDDLAGRLLKNEPGEWEVIRLPRFAEQGDPLGRAPGESLWPEWFDSKSDKDAMRNPEVFAALHQQRPTLEDGDYFQRNWIMPNTYDRNELPSFADLRIYAASDHACDEKQRSDPTCLLLSGVDKNGVTWVLPDLFWKRADTGTVVEKMLDLIATHKPITWWGENGQILKSIGPFLRQRMQERNTFCYIEGSSAHHDKPTRAQSIRGRFSLGLVRLPRFASWYGDALDELLRFPAGVHDDFVDALAHLGLGLDKMIPANRRIEKQGNDGPPVNWTPTFNWLKKSDNNRLQRKQLAYLDR